MSDEDNKAIENFQTYLKIRSVQPKPDYDGCIEFIKKQAASLQLPVKIYEFVKGKPVAVITWEGTDPKLPSILLNGHTDVVPVDEKLWMRDPFEAKIDEKGNIYARGTQDMKSVSIQYLEAIRRLKNKGIKLKRTVHVSFVPDEEIGGVDGMKAFVKSEEFKALNVGFALDEGVASTIEPFVIFYGEKVLWHIEIKCTGETGHGSRMLSNTAADKMRYVLNKFLDRRQYLEQQISEEMKRGEVTSINLTMIQGGLQSNVIPPEIKMVFDCRLHPSDVDTFEQEIKQWCSEAGEGVTYNFIQKDPVVPVTKLDETNPYWIAFKSAMDKINIQILEVFCMGTTDARYVREVGIPALGFSPMNHTPVLIHGNDEFLNKKTFLNGIEIYQNLLIAIANV